MASYSERKKKDEEVVEILRDAINAGNEAWDAVNRFHGKFLEASSKAGMLTEIRAPFNHICQGKDSSKLDQTTRNNGINEQLYFLHFTDTKEKLERFGIGNLQKELNSRGYTQ